MSNNNLSICAMLCERALITKLKKCFCRQGNEEDFPEPESDTVNMCWSCEKNALKQYRNKKGFAEDHMKDYCWKYLSNED